jgi:hypothetical protein
MTVTLAPLLARYSAAANLSVLTAFCSGVKPCVRRRRPNRKIVVEFWWVGAWRAHACAREAAR